MGKKNKRNDDGSWHDAIIVDPFVVTGAGSSLKGYQNIKKLHNEPPYLI